MCGKVRKLGPEPEGGGRPEEGRVGTDGVYYVGGGGGIGRRIDRSGDGQAGAEVIMRRVFEYIGEWHGTMGEAVNADKKFSRRNSQVDYGTYNMVSSSRLAKWSMTNA